MKISYNRQLILSLVIIVMFNVLNMLFKHWVFTSIGFSLCGLLWIIHPVPPKKIEKNKYIRMGIRFAGLILILIGIFTRLHF